MPETPPGGSTSASMRGSDGLLATKLYVPRPPPGFIPRQRLADQLEEGLSRTLSLLCAPAGSGKTALLADWCRRREQAVAWLSLDAGDNDPARFWRHVAAALDRVRPGIADHVAPLLAATTTFRDLAAAVVNAFAAEPADVVLVLDDYHVIDAEEVYDSIRFLIEHRPAGLHIVLSSRADPSLPLARLRAAGQLTEIRAVELRFTVQETAALLREALGSDMHADTVAALTARTEGWAVGLQLAALSLRDEPDTAGFVETFSGSHRYVLDYLAEEVLAHQPAHVQDFLLETSVLERLSGSLCDAVTGRGDSQVTLEQIERANLFLVPLDEKRGWWRYHHLFADLLRARLPQRQPGRVDVLHRNAASWYDEHGLADDAVRHAMAAGDSAWAARLVERYFDEHYLSSERATVQRWIATLPPRLVASRPRLHLAQAALHVVGGRVKDVENALHDAERVLHTVEDEPFEPSVGSTASRLANMPAAIAVGGAYVAHLRGDEEATIAFSSRALDELSDGEWMLEGLAHSTLAIAEWLGGRLQEAERAVASIIDWWQSAGDQDLIALTSSYLGRIQSAQGRLDSALQTYHRTLEVAEMSGRPAQPAIGVAYAGTAAVAYQRGEFDNAMQHLDLGLPLCRQFVYTLPLAIGLVTLAWIKQAQGDAAGARRAMEEAERLTDPTVADLFNPVPAQRARLSLAQGDAGWAARWTVERGLSHDDELSFAREPAYLVLARVLLAQHEPGRALHLLERMHALALEQDRVGSVIEIQALRALALTATGNDDAAVPTLADALILAQPQGHIRVFVDEGEPMAVLLGRLIATQRTGHAVVAGVPVGFLGLLMRAFEARTGSEPPHAVPGGSNVPGLVTQLSAREVEVLQLLVAGKQNRDIAAELYLAVNTVKKHVTHILDKLGAANRTDASARARELGLLSTPRS
ncbi:LuxR C-terminal-related transcriptional regulator [Phytoactinopolyspora endophytica]|uniref:LuxR C-terminal-related transcriptional regulator n=1 Tax=Phytoactinopolyspora endophytica TaxID=1642495 RepID=UPI00101DA608|nr:LuxR C-terminal-related transcriptional regulator [Phytoactinopolyspora endophytica]